MARSTLTILAAEGQLTSWVVARRRADRYIVLAAVDDGLGLAEVGTDVAWDDTVCAMVAAGVGAGWAYDVNTHPDYAAAPIVAAEIGGYVGHPLVDGDGVVIGSLCGFARTPLLDPERLLPLVVHHAGVLSALLEAEREVDAAAARLRRVESESAVDALTGIGNRRAWDRAVETSERRCRAHGDIASMVLFDVDGLKAINDVAGHDAGDAVLRAVAGAMADQAAIREDTTAARLGGDEFGLLVHGVGSATADQVARSVADALAARGIVVSVGVAERRADRGLAAARHVADAALYADKGTPIGATGAAAVVPVNAVPGRADRAIHRLLDALRAQLGMEVAFVGEWTGDERIFRHVSAPRTLRRQLLGTAQPLAATVCKALVDDPTLQALPDAGADPATADIAVVRAFGIGAHLGIPLRLRDGRLYGTLCCAALHPDPAVSRRDLATLHIVADAIVDRLEEELVDSERRAAGNRELDAVLAEGGPTILFQPVVSVADRSIVGYEALSRFGPALGNDPGSWFSAAAALGRDVTLELAAIRRAIEEARPLGPGWLAVNASPATLTSSGLPVALAAADRPVVVELTEHLALDDIDGVRAAVEDLRAAGHRIAIDDAGIGHSGLARIVSLRPDLLKIDRYLVDGVAVDPVRRTAVRMLDEIARSMGAVSVAEGIERAADLAVVETLGVELAQGFLLHRPAPAGDLGERVLAAT